MLAYDYPLLGAFWTVLWLFVWIMWLFLLIRVFADIFRSHDLGGWGKALWTIFVIILPFIGVLVYLIARGQSMAHRDVDAMQAQQKAFDSYVKSVAASGGGTADELTKLADLKERGAISDDEFQQQKAKILS